MFGLMGMKKRLDVAIALMHNPEILIMDEPTADLDPLLRSTMLDLIKKINSDGKSVQIGYSTIPIDKVYKYTQQNHIELHHTYTYKWPLHTGDIITLRETFITNNKHVKLSTKYTVIKIIFQLGMEDEYYIFNDNDDLICFHENDFYFVSRSK